ncbi:hypothetical protein ShzoTeo12_11360 [Shinella zoogloeoides]|nr:hypothetical protein ShzoTeo12_11360 [Shinella zoogloeoides]
MATDKAESGPKPAPQGKDTPRVTRDMVVGRRGSYSTR